MSPRRIAAAALVLAALLASSASHAQSAEPVRNVFSINPLLAVGEYYVAEYERALASSASLAVGGSYWSEDGGDDATYTSTDLKLRYYPSGRALRGFSLAGLVGYTGVSALETDDVTGTRSRERVNALALGTQLDYSWLLGAKERFSVGLGLGAKRLILLGDELDDEDVSVTIPTMRLSVGLAF